MGSTAVSEEQELMAAKEKLLIHDRSNMHSNDNDIGYEKLASANEKLPFPKGAYFLLICKFSEWFALCGVKTVLVMYLTRYLAFSAQDATVLYHAFLSIIFMTSILGAIIADSWLGKYRTVLYMFIAYAIGMVILNLGSVPVFELPSREFTIVAIIMIAMGTGSMKPCFMALGGDQFKLPQQKKELGLHYSWHYCAIHSAYLTASALTPVLRNDVKCFGTDYCFPLAFGVPGTFLIISLIIFLVGSKYIAKKLPDENIVVEVTKCIWSGARQSLKHKQNNPQPHWLDHAIPKYGKQLVDDIKIVLNTIATFLPIPMVWALNDQTGSRWTLQATTLNGDLGFYEIKPDQMQFFMPVMAMLFISLLDCVLYPALNKVGINSDLRRLVVGSIAMVLAFIAAGVLQLQTMPTLAVAPIAGHCQVNLYNSLSCGFNLKSNVPELNNVWLSPLDSYETYVKVNPFGYINVTFESDSKKCSTFPFQTNLLPEKAVGVLFQTDHTLTFDEITLKNAKGLSRLRILSNDPTNPPLIISELNQTNHNISTHSIDPNLVHPGKYRITFNNTILTDLKLGPGSVTTLLYSNMSTTGFGTKTIEITPPNSVHMLWMLPQYAFVGLGDAIIGVTGLRFAYNEAPASMKTVMLSFWLLTMSAGNVIAIIVVRMQVFETEAYVSFLFATLMLVDCAWLMWLIKRYKTLNYERQTN